MAGNKLQKLFNHSQPIGFTLVEVLITITIFTLVVIAAFNVYFLAQRFYSKGEIRAELLQNGKVVLERMTREIRQARTIVTSLSDQEADATNTIVFEDGHSTTTYRYIHYFQDAHYVEREVVGYYFSGDADRTLEPFNATPPEGQTLEEETLEAPEIIGEYISDFKIWEKGLIFVSLTLENRGESIKMRTGVFSRNL